MFTKLIHRDYPTTHDEMEEIDSRFYRHGWLHHQCDVSDSEDDTDIDKCLNCGRYKASTSLNKDQCCAKGCKNPNEY